MLLKLVKSLTGIRRKICLEFESSISEGITTKGQNADLLNFIIMLQALALHRKFNIK